MADEESVSSGCHRAPLIHAQRQDSRRLCSPVILCGSFIAVVNVLLFFWVFPCSFLLPRALRSSSAHANVTLFVPGHVDFTHISLRLPRANESSAAPARTSLVAQGHVDFSRVTRGIDELMAAGGVYIYRSDEMLAMAHAPVLRWKGVEAESPLFPLSDGNSVDSLAQYGLDAALVRLLQDSPYVTDDPASAAMFVVPQYATFEAHYCMGSSPLGECGANISRDYLLPLAREVQKTPAYQRHGGHDHVWAFPWDFSWTLFPGVPEALRTSLFWGYEGPAENLIATPCTIRAPGGVELTERNSVLGGTSDRVYSEERLASPGEDIECLEMPPHTYLASFAGTVHETRSYSRGVRQDLLATYPEADASATRVIILNRHVDSVEYAALLRDSLFCLAPQGWAPWSPRLYFAIFAGCIPVLFDVPGFNMKLPYLDVLPWREMSITVRAEDAVRLHEVLGRVSPVTVCRMRRLLSEAAPLLMWGTSPQMTLMGALSEAWFRISNTTTRSSG